MDDPADQLALVRKALTSGLSNCVEWVNDEALKRVRDDPGNQGLTPEGIKQLLIEFVQAGGEITQRIEERQRWKDQRDYWYMAVVPVDGFRHGLFVEMD